MIFQIISTMLMLVLVSGCSKRGMEYPSGSMEPAIPMGSVVTIDYAFYDDAPVSRGDIVAFHPDMMPEQLWCFRVAGLPGEEISVINDSLLIEGKPVGYRILHRSDPGRMTEALTLAKDEYYVLGDNRDDALDSRFIGPVRRETIVGKVIGVHPPD
jgi:signal peptidase I